MKRLALCADDYGLSAPISRAILQLAERGRLSDVSCIVNAPAWPGFARPLAGSGVRAGLHLNLTEGRPLSAALAAQWPVLPALPRLIMLAHLRRLPRAALRDELNAQLGAFEQASGQAPRHIDGHQHVHHLPLLRDLVLDLLAARPGLLARNTGRVDGPGFAVKRALIAGTGGRAMGLRLAAIGRSQNERLFGVYDFADPDGSSESSGSYYRGLMQRWLAAIPAHGALLFCHPGDADSGDPIAAARTRERAYLGGPAFTDDLAAAGIALAR